MATIKYMVVDNDGNALGPYECTAKEAQKVTDVHLIPLNRYISDKEDR